MRRFLFTCVALFISCAPVTASAEEEQCVNREVRMTCATVQSGANRAATLLRNSERDVDQSFQLLAEWDRICMVNYTWPGRTGNMTLTVEWCVEQTGSYDLRAAGLNQQALASWRSYVDRIYTRSNSWALFEYHVLGDVERFAQLQWHIRSGTEFRRARILELALRRDVVYFGQEHPDGLITQ